MIDGELPNAFIGKAMSASGAVVGALMSASASFLLASIPAVLGSVYAIQKVCLRTSRQIRLLDLEAKSHENQEPVTSWPGEGAISIKGFSAAYSESSDLDICPGERFGICGRSGSGKSSLLASFFRLLEYREGFIRSMTKI